MADKRVTKKAVIPLVCAIDLLSINKAFNLFGEELGETLLTHSSHSNV